MRSKASAKGAKLAQNKRPATVKRGKAAKSVRVREPMTTASLESLNQPHQLVILTGMSGSGKLSALKAFEDLGYYSVDNLPLELVPRFADLVHQSAQIDRAALVVDVREGMRLDKCPGHPEAGSQGPVDACRVSRGFRRSTRPAFFGDTSSAPDGPRRKGKRRDCSAVNSRGAKAA